MLQTVGWMESIVHWSGRDEDAYKRVQQVLEWPMVVLALTFVPIILVPVFWDLTPAVEAGVEGLVWFIWGAFVLEYLVLLWLAPDRWLMVRTHWLDLLIIVFPFFRPLRAGRALRALRLVTVAGRVTVGVRRAFGRKGFTPFLVAVGAVVASCGVGVWLVERDIVGAQITTFSDGLWWALVTSTTVGYGDLVPVTPVGRGLAAVLMITGVALLSVVTANIAAFFVEEHEAADHDVADRLERIESLLLEMRGQP